MIAVKDIVEMPQSCGECPRTTMCSTYLNQYVNCPSTRYSYGQDKRPNDCPLVEIVTCKDCKYCVMTELGCYCDRHIHRLDTHLDKYCADAERRE